MKRKSDIVHNNVPRKVKERINTITTLKMKSRTRPFRSPKLPHMIAPAKLKYQLGTGKTCAIVGNAASIFEHSAGVDIDANDIVVRINVPSIVSQEHQGTRTDLLFVHTQSEARLSRLVRATQETVNINVEAVELFQYWTDVLRKEVDNPKVRPSTGFIAIMYMLKLQYQIKLFGFDWFATPTYYTNSPPWEHHQPEWEKLKVKELLGL